MLQVYNKLRPGLTWLLLIFVTIAANPADRRQLEILPPIPDAESAVTAPGRERNVIVIFDALPVYAYRERQGIDLFGNEIESVNTIRRYAGRLKADQQQFARDVRSLGIHIEISHSYTHLLSGMALTLFEDDISRISEWPGVSAVLPDRVVHLDLVESVPLTGADQVWQIQDEIGRYVTGEGVRVAVIDTGIDYTHLDLGGCFGHGCKVTAGFDLYNGDPDPLDDNGHGTHCAGIVAANGSLKGMAPDAELLAFKVLNQYGYGSVSTIIAALEMAADPDGDPGTSDAVDIISMSLGQPGSPDDAWSMAVNAAVDNGIVVVVSAGNEGPSYATVSSPGMAQRSIAVGATDKSDRIAAFSSRGPVTGSDVWLKPDLVAPGVEIFSTYLGGLYAYGTGTSMAAPHVAGAAALLKQMHPEWTPAYVRANLMNTAFDLGLNIHTQGAGRLQVNAAVQADVVVTPSSLSFGTVNLAELLWSDTRLVWIENISDASLSLTLDADTLISAGVSIRIFPETLELNPGEIQPVSVVLAVETSLAPPDLDRNQGSIRIQDGGSVYVVPFAYQTPPMFAEGPVFTFGLQTSYAVALADLDEDGDLDAVFGNTGYYDNPANTVWFNDGAGKFIDSGQRLGNSFTWDIALEDLDNDGDLDLYAANSQLNMGEPDEIWLNDGNGIFADSGQRIGNSLSRAVALGDLDGDGDVDAFVTNGIADSGPPKPDSVWFNDGKGNFTDSGQVLGNSAGLDVALADLDLDGDLDAFVANGDPFKARGVPNSVWINDGSGGFTTGGQSLGNALSQAVVLGDLDADGDLDVFVANGGASILDGQPDEVWLNNGDSQFVDSGQRLGGFSSYGAALGDIHQDGTLDVFVAGYHGGHQVWINDGLGHLTLSGLGLGNESGADVVLADLDVDGDLDALVANALGLPNRLWVNRGSGSSVLYGLDAPEGLQAVLGPGITVRLDWRDVESRETGYLVERSLDGQVNWSVVAVLPPDSVTYLDTTISCSTYFYRVRAIDLVNNTSSPYSHVTLVTISCRFVAPTNLSATPVTVERVDLAWTDNAADESGYRIERSPDGVSGWVEVGSVGADEEKFSDVDVACGETYWYRVRAYRASDGVYSSYSNLASATPTACALPAPTNLAATAVAAERVDLAWTDNASDESGYRIERSPDGVSGWVEIDSVGADVENFSDVDVAGGATYWYRVRAYRAADATYSGYSIAVEVAIQEIEYPVFLPLIIVGAN